jgi:hypothetical protein
MARYCGAWIQPGARTTWPPGFGRWKLSGHVGGAHSIIPKGKTVVYCQMGTRRSHEELILKDWLRKRDSL